MEKKESENKHDKTVYISPLLKRVQDTILAYKHEMEQGYSSNVAVGMITKRVIDTFPDNKDAVLESIGYAIVNFGEELLKKHGMTIDREIYEIHKIKHKHDKK